MSARWWFFPLSLLISCAAALALVFVFAAIIVSPSLPDLSVLTDYRPKVPLRIFSIGPVER